MIIKSYEIEKNKSSLLEKKIFLLYGENNGLKNEIIKVEPPPKKAQNTSAQDLEFLDILWSASFLLGISTIFASFHSKRQDFLTFSAA